jgi:hypothetical protein
MTSCEHGASTGAVNRHSACARLYKCELHDNLGYDLEQNFENDLENDLGIGLLE